MAGAKRRARQTATKAKKRRKGKRRKVGCAACAKSCADLAAKHKQRMENLKETPNAAMKKDVANFKRNYQAHKAEYEALGKELDYPPEIIAINHWRESHGDFSKNLANGEPLGRVTQKVPKGLMFRTFGESARYAMKKFKTCKDSLGLHYGTKDKAKAAAFMENYNGRGYSNRGTASPYVYSGTNQYTSGKYVEVLSGGKYVSRYMPNVVDKQTGGILLYDAVVDE